MARNPHPEETVRRILDVAEELFCTRGYEHTTMADIVDGLGGPTTSRARRRSSRRSSSAPTNRSSRAPGRSLPTAA